MARRSRKYWKRFKKKLRELGIPADTEAGFPAPQPPSDADGDAMHGDTRGGDSFLLSDPRTNNLRTDLALINKFGLSKTMPEARMAGLHRQMADLVESHPKATIRKMAYQALQKTWDRESQNHIEILKLEHRNNGNGFPAGNMPIQDAPAPQEPEAVETEGDTIAESQRKEAVYGLLRGLDGEAQDA